MIDPSRITIIGVKLGSVIANFASIAGFAFYLADRTSSIPTVSGPGALNRVLHLALLSAILYGILWSLAERLSGWDFGAGGGDKEPSGWSAVVLSLSITLPPRDRSIRVWPGDEGSSDSPIALESNDSRHYARCGCSPPALWNKISKTERTSPLDCAISAATVVCERIAIRARLQHYVFQYYRPSVPNHR
jgi:hypothetical protein